MAANLAIFNAFKKHKDIPNPHKRQYVPALCWQKPYAFLPLDARHDVDVSYRKKMTSVKCARCQTYTFVARVTSAEPSYLSLP